MPHIVHIVHIVHLPRSAGLVIQKSSKKVSGPDCPSVHRNHYPLIRQHPPACPATAPSERAGQKALSARVRPPSPVSLISLIRVQSREGSVERNTGCGSDVCSVSPLLCCHCPRPPDRGSNQAQTCNPCSSHHRLRPRRHHHRHGHGGLVSSRNGAILSVVAGEHCRGPWAGVLLCRIVATGGAEVRAIK